jgi:hypothetical protein
MANGIKRKQILGISKQATFGVADTQNDKYWMPVMEMTIGEEVSYIENEAFTGSIYKANDALPVMKMCKPSFTVKVSEAELPLLLLSFGTMSSALYTGETAVYEHVVTFTNSNQKQLYTLFLDDPDRTDLIIDSFRVDTFNISFEKGGWITAEISGLARYPQTGTVSPTLTEWLEFNTRHCNFLINDEGQTVATINLLSAKLNHSFGVSDNDDNFYLGSSDLSTSFNKEAEFSHEVSLHFPDLTYKNKWSAGTRQAFRANITDTSRFVTGSVANTNPLIRFDYPSAYLSSWSEDGGAGDILKQTLTIKAIDRVTVTDAPIKITVRNAVASY